MHCCNTWLFYNRIFHFIYLQVRLWCVFCSHYISVCFLNAVLAEKKRKPCHHCNERYLYQLPGSKPPWSPPLMSHSQKTGLFSPRMCDGGCADGRVWLHGSSDLHLWEQTYCGSVAGMSTRIQVRGQGKHRMWTHTRVSEGRDRKKSSVLRVGETKSAKLKGNDERWVCVAH